MNDQLPAETLPSETIEAIAFAPSDARPEKRSIALWQWLVGLAVLLTVGIFWFLFTSKSVQIKFSPAAADVDISGGLVFELGGVYLLRRGSYDLSAHAALHEALNTTIDIGEARNQTIALSFTPLPGFLALDVLPDDAQIAVDGTAVASQRLELAAGEHELEIAHPRYLPHTQIVDIEGKRIEQALEVRLAPNWANVNVTSKPEGAAVRIDGENTGASTPAVIEAMAGEREISVQLDGYKTHRQRIFAQAGQAMTLAPISLVQADAQLSLTSQPAGAGVTVNGRFAGQTPIQLDLKSAQAHRIQIIRSGYETFNKTISLARGDNESLNVRLTQQRGNVVVQVEPENASLRIDGELQPSANQTFTLPARPHEIELSLEGYAGYAKTITPKSGLTQEVKVRLLTLAEARMRAMQPTITSPAGQNLILFEPFLVRMGASRREPGRRANETMVDVTLTRLFYMSTTEVTNAQFRQFASGHDSGSYEEVSLNEDDMPVVKVGWNEAAAYCNWLSEKAGIPRFYNIEFGKVKSVNQSATGYRLPTEAEWAWAARTTIDKNPDNQLRFPWGQNLPPPDRHGNYADRAAASLVGRIIFGFNDNHAATAPVATFKANHRDLYDMGGNVAEWVNDFYHIPTADAATDPLGPDSGDYHTIRGSSWMHGTVTELRYSFRDYGIEGREDVGFRIARFAE